MKRRVAKSKIPVTSWDQLTDNERRWLQCEPLHHEPFGEMWGFASDREVEARDIWRRGRPTASELLKLYEGWKRCR